MEATHRQARPFILDKALYYRSHIIQYGKYGLLVAVAFILIACQKDNDEIRILFVGDILLARNVKQEYSSHKSFPWEHLKDCFQSYDLVIGNLEGAVGDLTQQIINTSESPVFAVESNDISLLKQAGFKAITFENNHIFDLGLEGKKQTLSTLINNDIKPISFENSPNFIHVKNKVISVISINLVPNRENNKSIIPSIEISQKLRLAKNLSNIVIVSIHWGSELLDWPSSDQRKAAEWLTKNGADVIIGHHPHIIQNPEIINGKPVFFSLGNHLFDQKYSDSKKGLMVEIKLRNGKFHCTEIKTRNAPNSFFPVIDTIKHTFNPIKFNNHLFTINKLTLIPLTIDSENKIILQGFFDEKLIWNSQPLSLITIEKTKIDGSNEHIFALEKYYSSLDKEINIRPYVYQVDKLGLIARWRGSALSWPILDARISPSDEKVLCAIHRGDAFISLGNINTEQRIVAYKWNGFGFDGLNDSISCNYCKNIFE